MLQELTYKTTRALRKREFFLGGRGRRLETKKRQFSEVTRVGGANISIDIACTVGAIEK